VIEDFYLFLTSVIFISFSGVMTPGPLFAVTVAKGLESKISGVLISLGHGIIEFPLMLLILFGLTPFLASGLTQKIIGLAGGFIMVYIGLRIIRLKIQTGGNSVATRNSALLAGVVATAANPYFLLWWATIGATLIMNAISFGFIGFLIFAIVHWLCDFVWNSCVSIAVFKSKRFLTTKAYKLIFGFCFTVFVGFGAWFIISALI